MESSPLTVSRADAHSALETPAFWTSLAFVLTFAAAAIGLKLQQDGVGVFWPAAGVIAGLAAATARANRVASCAGAAIALALCNVFEGRSFAAAAVFITCNLVQAVVLAALVDRMGARHAPLDRPARVAAFVAASAGVAALVGVPASVGLRAVGHAQSSAFDVWRLWFGGHSIGLLTVMPAVMLLAAPRRATLGDLVEDVALAFATAILALVVFGGVAPEALFAVLIGPVLMGPLVWWVWRRASADRAAAALVGLAGMTIWLVADSQGMFAGRVALAQAFLASGAAALLMLGAWRERASTATRRSAAGRDLRGLIVLTPLAAFAAIAWWTWTRMEIDPPGEAFEHEVWPFGALALAASGALLWLSRQLEEAAAEAEAARAEARRRLDTSYLLDLGDALNECADPAEVAAAACERLARRLDRSDGRAPERLSVAWLESPLADRALAATLDNAAVDALRRGEAVIGARRSDGAALVAPATHGGEVVAALVVRDPERRDWSPADLSIARQTAERAWMSIARMRAEAERTVAAERLRLAAEAAGFGAYDFDTATRKTGSTEGLRRIVGDNEGEVVTLQDTLARIHPEDRSRVENWMRSALRHPGPYETIYRIVARDGAVRHVLDRGESIGPVDPRSGEVRAVRGTLVDITAYADAQQSLTASEARFRHAFENAGVSLWEEDFSPLVDRLEALKAEGVTDLRTWLEADPDRIDALMSLVRVLDVNAETLRLFEASDKEELRRGLGGVVRPETRPVHVEELCLLFRGERVMRAEAPMRTLRGRPLDVLFTLVLNSPRGERALVSLADITERKRSEEALRASRDAFRQLVESSPFGVYTVDADFRLAQVSAGAGAVFRNVRPLLGRDLGDVLRIIWPEPFASEAIARFRHTLETGEPYLAPATVERRRDTGREESYDWQIERVIMPDGRPGVVCHFYDLSERQRHEAQVRLLMREVNHRSKNMLSLVQAIARQTAASAPEDFVARFEERIQSLNASQDLLVYNDWRGVEILDLVRSQLGHFSDLIGRRITLSGPPVRLTAAAAQALGMALHELATNAGKYGALSDESGQVDVAWSIRQGDASTPRFSISWTERDGPPVAPPARKGFGARVLDAMARLSLGGDVALEFPPEGLRWRLDCDLARASDMTAET